MHTRRIAFAAAVLASLGGAGQAAADCAGRARAPWASSGKGYTIVATAAGAVCAKAAISLEILGPDGKVLYRYAETANNNVLTGDARTKAAMGKAIARLAAGTGQKTTADLPDWKAGDDQAGGGTDFPFFTTDGRPGTGMTRDAYLALRAAKRPMFCYQTGNETLPCVALMADGTVFSPGWQYTPGG